MKQAPAVKPKLGRPRLADPRLLRIRIDVSATELAALRDLATSRGRTVAGLMREMALQEAGFVRSNQTVDASAPVGVGRTIRTTRERLGLSQAVLAVMSGVSSSSVSLIECGHFGPVRRMKALAKISHVLNLETGQRPGKAECMRRP